MKPKQDHPLAGETEQLEPENVQWMFDQGYAEKDKQATRMTEKGIQWLQAIEELTQKILADIGAQHGSKKSTNKSG